jgi:hypothetical protein
MSFIGHALGKNDTTGGGGEGVEANSSVKPPDQKVNKP